MPINSRGTNHQALPWRNKPLNLSTIKSATALNIKPYCGATPQGTIFQVGQARGIKKALSKMVDVFSEEIKNPEEKIVAISHCNCYERAMDVKRMIEAKITPKKIIVLDTRGISSTYASDGGIIVSG